MFGNKSGHNKSIISGNSSDIGGSESRKSFLPNKRQKDAIKAKVEEHKKSKRITINDISQARLSVNEIDELQKS